MKLTDIKELDAFRLAVGKCEGDVWLESAEWDKYNLKSSLSQYIAFGALLSYHGHELELFCQFPSDEHYFFDFFQKNPNVL